MTDSVKSRPLMKVPPPAEEPTVQERLEALLLSMRANYEHNAPIAPGHLKELEALVAHGHGATGKPATGKPATAS